MESTWFNMNCKSTSQNMYKSSNKRMPLLEGVRNREQKGDQGQLARVPGWHQTDRLTLTHTHTHACARVPVISISTQEQ